MGQSGGAQSQEGGGTYVKAWPLEGGWREREGIQCGWSETLCVYVAVSGVCVQ